MGGKIRIKNREKGLLNRRLRTDRGEQGLETAFLREKREAKSRDLILNQGRPD